MDDVDPRDWHAWHAPYDDPASPLARRLRCVQAHVSAWCDERGEAAGRAVSICAGQGRDLLDVLGPRRAPVAARLVEADPRNAEDSRRRAESYGMTAIEVLVGDAGHASAYAGAVPADLVLACGVLGNISDADAHRTVAHLPMLCAEGATVVWTRTRREPDLTGVVRDWFAAAGFEEVAFEAPDDVLWSVGVHRLVAPPAPLDPGVHLFTFTA